MAAHTVFHHRIGGLHDEHLVDIRRKGIPSVEAHRWREHQAFELLGIGSDGKAHGQQAEQGFHGDKNEQWLQDVDWWTGNE